MAEKEPPRLDFRQMRDKLRGGGALPGGELSNPLEQLMVGKGVGKPWRRHVPL